MLASLFFEDEDRHNLEEECSDGKSNRGNGRLGRTGSAIQIGNTENVGGTAFGGVWSARTENCVAFVISWNAHGDGGTEKGRGDDRREVHCGRCEGSSTTFHRIVCVCKLLNIKEAEALMFEWQRWVGLRDSYRHLLTAIRLQIVNIKALVTSVTKLGSLAM